jgi:hypothetical protein
MVIRRATLDDIDWLLIELKKFSDFYNSKYPPLGPNEQHNISVLSNLITNHVFFMAEVDGVRAGFIAGFIHQNLFNPAINQLTELFWWVSEEFRNSKVGMALLQHYVEEGKKNSHWIIMTLEDVSPVKHTTIIKQGFRVKETNFIIEV